MAITIVQKGRRKKLILWVGFVIVLIALASIFYFVFLGAKPPVSEKPQEAVPVVSEELKKLDIKWEILKDERFQALESFPDISSLTVEESGRENPFVPY
ncbi:MAG: hypothetical protein COV69_03890 [Parcubacteria group bacterium CG11_big_fil_rev_8_21_14_0_20_39_14]|nr:MAG: hypothetical protein COV69_03890 [Parcubacteria group bacterium CG11_big_fil_rev_8_21_14_0_20_39_14]PIS35763.1 MAG: hypothetical protein COT36_00865 [Parcubacteria group bacterium CG08_land_8_20_14_0_20_38_56]